METERRDAQEFWTERGIYLQCKSMKSFMCQWNTKGVT